MQRKMTAIDYWKRGNLFLLKLRNPADAISDYTKAIEINPNYIDAYINRGYILDEQGKFVEAISDYTKAIELNPDIDAYYNRGIAYKSLRNFAEAIEDFTKVIEVDRKHFDAFISRGKAYKEQGMYAEAISDFTKAIKITPGYAEAYFQRGNIYATQRKFCEAISDYTKAIKINPNYAEAYFNRADVLDEQGKFAEAISDLTQAIKIKPNYVNAYFNLGVIYKAQRNFAEAIYNYNRVVEIKLDDEEARNNLKSSLRMVKNNFITEIQKLSNKKQIEILSQGLYPSTPLGEYFFEQEKLNNGILKEIENHLQILIEPSVSKAKLLFSAALYDKNSLFSVNTIPKELTSLTAEIYIKAERIMPACAFFSLRKKQDQSMPNESIRQSKC